VVTISFYDVPLTALIKDNKAPDVKCLAHRRGRFWERLLRHSLFLLRLHSGLSGQAEPLSYLHGHYSDRSTIHAPIRPIILAITVNLARKAP
jgi:hypothetical protein